ncbi:hypothetical protein EVAR_67395_1 [Eumeta japonica]|uniref:Uncharacterized protein n=1 Tax=Eumeta variegata TaxID=151549 RepID=A0A4C2A0D1_EUMVA|nr:hypothetical protein EVAR_67395_1 [Eumeta japonica]
MNKTKIVREANFSVLCARWSVNTTAQSYDALRGAQRPPAHNDAGRDERPVYLQMYGDVQLTNVCPLGIDSRRCYQLFRRPRYRWITVFDDPTKCDLLNSVTVPLAENNSIAILMMRVVPSYALSTLFRHTKVWNDLSLAVFRINYERIVFKERIHFFLKGLPFFAFGLAVLCIFQLALRVYDNFTPPIRLRADAAAEYRTVKKFSAPPIPISRNTAGKVRRFTPPRCRRSVFSPNPGVPPEMRALTKRNAERNKVRQPKRWEEDLKRTAAPECMRIARDRDKGKPLEQAYTEGQTGKKVPPIHSNT